MLKLFSKQRGAVTVFLVIILVPTITICSLFVDASRMELAKPVVKSAGNLALNTMLTEYDEQLNEIYGLLGSCQDTDDLKETVKQYFVDSLKSQGIANAETEEIVGKLDQALDEDIVDLLDINASNVEITPVENGNLSNPALVKQQIVEFMKYRAPIGLASGLLDTIKKVAAKSKTAKLETKVTEEKQDYYEVENELLELLKKIYDELLEFKKLNLTKDYIDNQVIPDITRNFKSDYKKIHTKIVFDLSNTGGMQVFGIEQIKYKVSEYSNSDFKGDKKFDSNNKASTSDVQNRADKFEGSISKYLQKKKSMQNIWNYYGFDNTIYRTQYWAKSIELINANQNQYSEYIDAAKEMCRQYFLFNNACENTNQTETINIKHDNDINDYIGDGHFSGDKTISFSINKNSNQSLANIYKSLKKDFESSGFYGKTAQLLNQISKEAIQGKSTLDIGTAGANGKTGIINTTATNEKIYSICSKYKEYYYKFKKADEHLKEAQRCMKKIGNSNSGLIKKTVDAYEDWEKQSEKLDKTDSDMKADNKKDLEEEKKLIEENLTDESLKELSNRIDNVKSLIKTIDDNINSTKYHKTQLKDIDSIEIAKSKAGIKNDKISYIYNKLREYADKTFKFATGDKSVNVKNSNHPDIERVNEPKLYKWMKEKFKKNNTKKSEDEAKDEYEDYKDKSEDDSYEDGEVSKTSNEIKTQKNLPSSGSGSEKKEKTAQISKVTNFLTNMFSDGILDNLENLGKSFRDDLYTTDYVMNMFSYDTFANEGKKKYKEDTNSTISTEDFESNKDKTFGYNKTLTNMPINKDNNFAYQGEVEYILYGNYNVINKANAYGRIFLLRYAFNLTPVFQKFWKNVSVTRDSALISSATYGVIPEPLVKLAICLMLNVVETGNDLIILRSGEGVPLIKKSNGVNVEYPGIIKNKKVSKNDFKPRYSDYMSLFLFLKLASTSENDVYKRIADVIQMNMSKVAKKKNFQLKKSVVYYQIKANISIPPLLLDLQINQGENAYKLNTLCDYEYKNIAGY
ncbi:MAG: DUF5702 domain-containing protein [Eubacterium sp.]